MDKKWLVVPLASLTLLGAGCAQAQIPEPASAPVAVEVAPAVVEPNPAGPASVPDYEAPATEEWTYGDGLIERYYGDADWMIFEGEIEGKLVSYFTSSKAPAGWLYLRVADPYGADVLYQAREDWTIPRDPVECVYISAGDRVQSYCDSEGAPAWAGEYPPFRVIADRGSDYYSAEDLGDYVDTLVTPVMESAQQRYLNYLELIGQYGTLQLSDSLLPYQREAVDAIESPEPASTGMAPAAEEQTYGDGSIESYYWDAERMIFDGEIEGKDVSLWENADGFYLRIANPDGPDVLYLKGGSETIDCVYVSSGDRVLRFCDTGLVPPFSIIGDRAEDSVDYDGAEFGESLESFLTPVMESAQQRYLSYLELIEQYDTLQKDETLLPYQAEALDAIEK